MESAELERAILAALAPRSLAERLRLRLTGGLSPRQVFERLDDDARVEVLRADLAPVAAELRAVERVAALLRQLVGAGRARHQTLELRQDMRVKGVRAIEIDVYRIG